MDKKALRELIVVSILAIIVALTIILTDKIFIPLIDDLEAWGNYGDFYGGLIGTLVSLVAVFLVYKTYQVQKQELSETKDTLTKQNFDSFFFELLGFFRQTKLEIKFYQSSSNLEVRYRGDAALIQLRKKIYENFPQYEQRKADYENYFEYVVPKLSSRSNYFSIFHLFFRILETIEEKSKDSEDTKIEKNEYLKTFRALINQDMLLLISCNIPYLTNEKTRSEYKNLFIKAGFYEELQVTDYLMKELNDFYE